MAHRTSLDTHVPGAELSTPDVFRTIAPAVLPLETSQPRATRWIEANAGALSTGSERPVPLLSHTMNLVEAASGSANTRNKAPGTCGKRPMVVHPRQHNRG